MKYATWKLRILEESVWSCSGSKIKDMGGVGAFNGREANPLVQTRRLRVLSAQAYTAEVGPGLINETDDQCSSYALVPPRRAHVNTTDAAHVGTAGKGITVKASHGNEQALIQMAAEDLSRSIETVFCAGPLLR